MNFLKVSGHLVETVFENAELTRRQIGYANIQLALTHSADSFDQTHHRAGQRTGHGQCQWGQHDQPEGNNQGASLNKVVLAFAEFVGGSDIMMEMYESGELQQLFADSGLTSAN